MKDEMLPLLEADLHANHTAQIKFHCLRFNQLIKHAIQYDTIQYDQMRHLFFMARSINMSNSVCKNDTLKDEKEHKNEHDLDPKCLDDRVALVHLIMITVLLSGIAFQHGGI